MKLSDYVFRFLADLGVKHVFMLPGGGAMHLNDSLGRCEGIQYVSNHHEQASAIAAEAYARVTNHLGVALVTTGPGGTNAITGVAAAWLDSTPCLFLSGQVKRADMMGDLGVRQLGVQEMDIVTLVKSITKYAVTVMDPATIRYHLEKAVYLAKSGRPGPAWIDIPLDVQAAAIDPAALPAFDPGEVSQDARQVGAGASSEIGAGACRDIGAGACRPVLSGPTRPGSESPSAGSEADARQIVPATQDAALETLVDKTIQLLNQSERPILLAGNGIRIAGAENDFLRLVDQLGIPVLTTRLGVDLLPASHSWLVGMPGGIAPRGANFALQNSDWLLILGARLDMALIAYAPEKLARAAKKIMVNLDGAEIAKLRGAIDLPVVADARQFILELAKQAGRIVPKDRSPWITRCRQWKDAYPFVLPEHRQQTQGISLYAFSEVLSDELCGDDIVLPGNSGFAAEIFLTAFKVKAGQRVFHNKGTGAMGFSQPAAIGACLAGGRRRTVCVDGDGGFQLNLQELQTVKRLELPIKFFVIDNAGYASIRASQQGYFGRLTGADATSGLTLPDLVKVASAYGLGAMRISNPADMRAQVRQALAMPGPVVCDVVTIPDEPRAPRVASVQRPDGSMVSKPLEDMWPFLPREEFLANMIVPPLEE